MATLKRNGMADLQIMTVGDLREMLDGIDDDRLVVMQTSLNNHGCLTVVDGWTGNFVVTGRTMGNAGLKSLTDEHRAAGFTDEDVLGGVPALVLVPNC